MMLKLGLFIPPPPPFLSGLHVGVIYTLFVPVQYSTV